MTRASFVLCLMVCAAGAAAADDLRSLSVRYRDALKKVSGKPEDRAKKAREHIAPIVRKIGQLDTDRSLAFLVGEYNSALGEVAAVCPEGILESSNPRAVGLVLDGFSRRAAVVQRGALSALAATKRDLSGAEVELVALARARLRPDVRAQLAKVLGKLDSVNAARALLSQAGGSTRSRGEGGQRYAEAVVEALRKTKSDDVRKWLAGKAFDVAGSDEARLHVVLKLVADLRLSDAREHLARLVSHRSPDVGARAIDALTRIGVGEASDEIADALERRRGPSGLKFRVRAMDALAASGGAGREVVIDFARGRDAEMRLIAIGSLGLLPGLGKDDRAFAAVLDGLKDSDPKVRAVALRALRTQRRKEMVGPLIKALDEKNEYAHRVKALELLVNVTGQNMGLVQADWNKWWDLARTSFEVAEKPGKEFTSVQAYDLEYFGIEVSSKKLSFLVDISSSMTQMVAVKRAVGGDEGDGGRKRGGRTRPTDGGGDGGEEKGKGGVKGGKARKIDVLKAELVRVLRKLPADALVNIVTFDAEIEPWQRQLQPMKGSGRNKAVRYVQSIKTGVGTNVFDTLEFALKDRRVDTVYLLTDGVPTRGRLTDPAAIIAEVDKLNRLRAVTIHCIAFGKDSDLLKKLAARNGGKYRFVDRY